jgi:hypothetical protein
MARFPLALSALAAAVLALGLAGCGEGGSSPDAAPGTGSGTAAPGHDHDHADHDHAPAGDLSEQAKALAELSEEDRALAEKQKICPVSGQPLGSMGKPYKVTVQDRVVFLCCQGCEEAVKSEPDKYLAKLDE